MGFGGSRSVVVESSDNFDLATWLSIGLDLSRGRKVENRIQGQLVAALMRWKRYPEVARLRLVLLDLLAHLDD
jgi:hypothetical protein